MRLMAILAVLALAPAAWSHAGSAGEGSMAVADAGQATDGGQSGASVCQPGSRLCQPNTGQGTGGAGAQQGDDAAAGARSRAAALPMATRGLGEAQAVAAPGHQTARIGNPAASAPIRTAETLTTGSTTARTTETSTRGTSSVWTTASSTSRIRTARPLVPLQTEEAPACLSVGRVSPCLRALCRA